MNDTKDAYRIILSLVNYTSNKTIHKKFNTFFFYFLLLACQCDTRNDVGY